MTVLNTDYILSNGVAIPKIAFGTWQIPSGEVAYESTIAALKAGYRHIDTAAAYGNEESIGRAIKDLGIKREDIFITSKLKAEIKGYQEALDEYEGTIKRLGVEYLDLYLIHAPWPWDAIGKDCHIGNVESWKAFEKLYKEKRVRAIGVSNFSPNDLNYILDACTIIPMVNQICLHIGNNQEETVDFCKKLNIQIEAYSPLATGRILDKEEIKQMATKYQVTPAQLCIRYCIEKGTLPLPKTTNEKRMIENSKVDFSISKEDMSILKAIK